MPNQELVIASELMQAMRAAVERSLPLEACGLLAGVGNEALAVLPVTNSLRSPVAYRMDPQEQLQAFLSIEAHGWDLLAIYHSHPSGPAHPSATDISQAYYPETPYLIWSPRKEGWQCRGFFIRDGEVSEIRLVVPPS
ncbi:MAG: M67 family metallopeptidase [Anaerolineales bacterium]|nr:M67 family metallopeptidase [Anaerolineales bacterium]